MYINSCFVYCEQLTILSEIRVCVCFVGETVFLRIPTLILVKRTPKKGAPHSVFSNFIVTTMTRTLELVRQGQKFLGVIK